MDGVPELGITFLGTAAASMSRSTNTSAQLVRCGESRMLVDCGTNAARQLALSPSEVTELTAVLLTHWHPDHSAGLPTLLRLAETRNREASLPVYGPAPPRGVWRAVRAASRTRLLAHLQPIEAGDVIELPGFRFTAIATSHAIPSVGWEIAETDGPGRRVVLSGDTRPVSGIAKAARAADLLVHEATFITRDRERAHASGHSTALEAAELAAEAGVGALALTHLPDRYERGQIMREAAAAFMPILVPHDLDRLEVEPVAKPRASARGVGWATIRIERDTLVSGA
jgi:ribonuclease Z